MKALRQITSCILYASLLIVPALVKGAPTSAYTYDSGSTISDRATPAEVSPVVPIGFSHEPYARADGRLFNINGKTQYFAGMYYTPNSIGLLLKKHQGTNTYWLGYLKENADVDLALQQLQSVSSNP